MAESIFLTYRRALIIGVHIGLWCFSMFVGFLLRFEFTIPKKYAEELLGWMAVLVALPEYTSDIATAATVPPGLPRVPPSAPVVDEGEGRAAVIPLRW